MTVAQHIESGSRGQDGIGLVRLASLTEGLTDRKFAIRFSELGGL